MDLFFRDDFEELALEEYEDYCVHVLCHRGCATFCMSGKSYTIGPDDFVIWVNGKTVSDLSVSEDFRGTIFYLSYRFSYLYDSQNAYHIKGHLSMLEDPVLHLTREEAELCDTTLRSIYRHTKWARHAYSRESLGYLVESFKLDLFGIHARIHSEDPKHGHAEHLFKEFVSMLEGGATREHRSVAYYAEKLYITPKYLSQICQKASGRNASDWISKYAMGELTTLLKDKSLSLNEITSIMNFSSPSYFSRFVRKNTGLSPSEFRAKS